MNTTQEYRPYRMSISLNVLNHLGIGLYSNIPAVLSEIVANAWDADATKVTIDIDNEHGEIRIWDDGNGMSRRDINDKYLKIGYNKRSVEGSITANKKRPVMGRKGIGKLSVFSIANSVEVHSVKNGERNGLIMNATEIQQKIKEEADKDNDSGNDEVQDFPYYPKFVPAEKITINRGTLIILRGLHKDTSRTSAFLRRRLARRFSVIGEKDDFLVIVDGKEITPLDRDYFHHFEFVWYFGKDSVDILGEDSNGNKKCPNLKHAIQLDPTVDAERGYQVRGWIGTVDEQEAIRSDDNINAIVIYAHGKLVHEDLLAGYKEGGIYSKYIVGEIDADFLDLDDRPDIVTSNRQSVREDDERFVALKEFVWQVLKQIQKRWTELRREVSLDRALEHQIIRDWYEKWRGDNRKAAERLFQKIEALPLPDKKGKMEMYKANILAFEKLALVNALSVLDNMETEEHFQAIAEIFRDIDDIEAAHYHEIVRGRIQVVEKFDNILPDVKEKVLQQYLFEHLWLLDPSWERAATDARIEQAVSEEFDVVTAGLTPEERDGRIDIRYRTAAGKHIIIELKKYDRVVDVTDLTKQVGKYKSALEKCLLTHRPNETHAIECIIILGQPPRSPGADAEEVLRPYKARYILYDALIEDTLRNYRDYLEMQREVSELARLLEQLTQEMLTASAS